MRLIRTWPETSSLSNDESNMLRAFFHFTSQIEGSSDDKIRVCMSNFVLGVEPLDIDLRCRKCLLSSRHPFPQFDEFCSPGELGCPPI